MMRLFLLQFAFCVWSFIPLAQAQSLRIVDITGNEVSLPRPAKKVILGEGRFLAVLGVLGVKKPLSRVAGMMNDFKRFDPVGYQQYEKAFPGINEIPTFGNTTEESVSVEKAILLQPDAAIFGLSGHGPGSKSTHILEKLKAANIPVVFIDFRKEPLKNTARSVEIVGEVLGLEANARKFTELYQKEVRKIEERVAKLSGNARPKVAIELRLDRSQGCCISVAEGMFADLVEVAGGANIAKGVLPGPVGTLSLEHLIASDPDVYIASAIGKPLAQANQQYNRVALGANVEEETARKSLSDVLSRPGFAGLSAVRKGNAHGLWHHFYNSPLNLYALQKIAVWLHPDIFSDLEPEKTLAKLLEGFTPVTLEGTYAISHRP